jgi:CRP-like cAMP-binding protein
MISPEILRRYSFFAGLDEAFMKKLAMAGEEVVLADGVWLFHEGDRADSFFVIVRGSVQLKARLPGGRYTDLESLVEGDLVGWSAVCDPNFYTYSAFTPTGARLLRMSGQSVREAMQDNPEMGYRLMCQFSQVIGKRLTNLRARFVSLVVV